MEHILVEFCGASGQRMNKNKSRIWFSPNTPQYLRNSICSEFGVVAMLDLGIYLGVPLIHGRNKWQHFKFLVERMEWKFAGWKMSMLSKVARIVLLSSMVTYLPLYHMNTMAIPKSLLAQLEGMCRRFFWGEIEGTRKMHTIAWSKIC